MRRSGFFAQVFYPFIFGAVVAANIWTATASMALASAAFAFTAGILSAIGRAES